MHGRHSVFMVAMLLASAGCIGTALHPLSDGTEVITEARLLGTWKGLSPPNGGRSLFDDTHWDPSGAWNIVAAAGQSFRATWSEGGETHIYSGRVVRLGRHLFLDLAPDSAESARCELFPTLPCHAFFNLRFAGDTMITGFLRAEWLEAAAAGGGLPEGTGFVFTEEDVALLTGKSPELQKVLLQAAADPAAFSIGRLVRTK